MKTLTIIIPVYNEEKRLSITFKALGEFCHPAGILVEKFVFVNDGSLDKTLKLLRKFQKDYSGKLPTKAKIEIVTYPENHGRGYAVMQGMKRVESDYGLFLDSDMSIPLSNLKSFSKHMNKGVDVLVGSKKLAQTVTLVRRSRTRELIGSVHSLILQRVLGIKLADFTGGFKVFSLAVCRDIFPRLTQERWGLDPEVIYVANKRGFEIRELPIVWQHVSISSKVNLVRDILRAFKEMAEIRINDFLNVYGLRETRLPAFSLGRKISPISVK
jgi:dolichyl-phosphate beta-glucosyltransferase